MVIALAGSQRPSTGEEVHLFSTDPESFHFSAHRMRHRCSVILLRPVRTSVLLALAVIMAPARADTEASGTWEWPVPPPHTVTRAFEAPPTPYSAGHRGIDIAALPGEPVTAPEAGVVHFAGVVVDRPVLSIAHEGDLISSFEPMEAVVAEGESVEKGQVIGTVSNGGHCSATCLHLGVRLHGQYVSPLLFLGDVPPAVLLPLE